MMPPTLSPAPLLAVEVPTGSAGVRVVAQALGLARDGSQSSALIPAYAPEPVRGRLADMVRTADWDPHNAAAVCVPTSGSTRAPRLVVMPWSTLLAATAARDEVLGGPAAWLVAVPPATAGGVVALARTLRAGTPFEAWGGVSGAGRFDPAAFASDAERLFGRAAQAGVPARATVVSTQVGRLLDDPLGRSALRRFDTVLVGGGPMSTNLRQRAAEAGVHIVHTYGMTETCGGFAYDGVPVAGSTVRVGDTGEIFVGGSCLAASYLDGPLPITDGWLHTGDRGAWDGTHVTVQGRIDEVVTVRGANVDLAAVAAVVAEDACVQQSAVVAVSDPDGGHRLRAFVVGTADPQTLRGSVHAALGAAAVPDVVIVDNLPANPGGKADVQRLREDAG